MAPPTRPHVATLFRRSLATLVLVAFAACSTESNPTNPDPDPTLSLSISPTTATVQQGGSTTFDGTATLGGSFSGTVTFTVTGLPSGVTVTVGGATVSGNTATATITIDVDAGVAAGSYPGTVTASGGGLTATQTYTLVVVAPTTGSYTMTGPQDGIAIQRGQSTGVTITINRTDFDEAVTLAAEGLPANVTASFDPAAPTGGSSVLTLDVAAGASAGTSTVTVRGTSSIDDVTITFPLTITDPPPASDISVDFSTCSAADKPVWVAYQDGMAGQWMVSTPVNDVYTFNNVSGDVFGFAAAFVDGSQTDISVDYFDPGQLTGTQNGCEESSGTKTISGTLAGNLGLTTAYLGGVGTFLGVDGPFQLNNVPDGSLPFVGYSRDLGNTVRRMLLLRNQDIADMGNIGTIDFTNDGFDPVSATFTVAGLTGSETGSAFTVDYAMPYGTGMCAVSPLNADVLNGTTFMGYSAPGSEQQAGEFHVAGVSAASASTTRLVKTSFSTFSDATVTLPPELPAPTLTDVTGTADYLRLQAEFTLDSEYNDVVFFDYEGATSNMSVFAFHGVFSGAVTLAMPDFTPLTGFDPMWAVGDSETGIETIIGGRGQVGGTAALCTAGGREVAASRGVTYN